MCDLVNRREPPDCPYATVRLTLRHGGWRPGPFRTYVHHAAHLVMIGWAVPNPASGPKALAAVRKMVDQYEAWHRRIGFTPSQVRAFAGDLRDEYTAWAAAAPTREKAPA